MGSRIHEVLEKHYIDLKHQKLNTVEDLLADFESRWRTEWHGDVVIRKADYTADNYFEMGRKCIRDYYERYYPFDQAVTLGLEKKVEFSLDPEGCYRMVGYIDRLDQRADGTYEIHDYKSSGSCPDQRYFDSDQQLALYQVALGQIFSDVRDVELVWHYLLFNKEFRSTRTPEALEQLKVDMINLIKTIETTEEFRPVESALCDWCDYPDLCPRKKHFYIIEQLPVNEYLNEPGLVLVDKLTELKAEKDSFVKDIESKIAKVEEAIVEYAKREGMDVIRGSTKKAKVKVEEVEKYPASGTKERAELEAIISLAGKLDDVLSFDIRKLAKAVKSNAWEPDLVAKVKEFGTREERHSVSLSKLSEKDLLLEEEIRD